jgi:hypothetical protein
MRSPFPGVGIFLSRYSRIVAVICCFTSATILAACGGNVNTTPVARSTPGSGSAVSVAPSSFNFSGTGVAYAQSLTISETGFTGPFTLSSCSGILGYAAAPGAGPSITTQLMPLSGGTCNLVVTDGIGGTTHIAVTVTTGNGSVSSRTRR